VEDGIINSIGLENPGVKIFIKEKLPFLRKLKIPFFVSISGETEDEFAELAEILDKELGIGAIELNLSCPNLHPVRNKSRHYVGTARRCISGGISNGVFGQDPRATHDIIKKVKKATSIPIIAKLTPQVNDITEIAKACKKADCDIISLINTIPAMVIDFNSGKPFLGAVTGGLSGPAIKPVALKMVYDVAKTLYPVRVRSPKGDRTEMPKAIPNSNGAIIGCGGIMNGKDAIEFILAGASAVSIGTASLASPDSSLKILKEIENYLIQKKINSIGSLIGRAVC